jgi:hypothetical protein
VLAGLAAATAPAPSGHATVWAVGDGANGSTASKAVAAVIAGGHPDRFLYLGDVYPNGSAADFRRAYDPVYGRLAARTAPTPGNHEWGQRAQGYFPYWKRKLGHDLAPWYAFDLAGWQILSLNSEAPHGPGSPQLRWLSRELATPGTCRLAYWHRPRFSAGLVHGDAPDTAPLWNARPATAWSRSWRARAATATTRWARVHRGWTSATPPTTAPPASSCSPAAPMSAWWRAEGSSSTRRTSRAPPSARPRP